MVDGIGETFRKHLGENVVGLRSLVDQVYHHMHNKVNRTDIKNLITARYSACVCVGVGVGVGCVLVQYPTRDYARWSAYVGVGVCWFNIPHETTLGGVLGACCIVEISLCAYDICSFRLDAFKLTGFTYSYPLPSSSFPPSPIPPPPPRLQQMERDILRREEEMLGMASTARCLSCGQLPPAHPVHTMPLGNKGGSKGMLRQGQGQAAFGVDPNPGFSKPNSRPNTQQRQQQPPHSATPSSASSRPPTGPRRRWRRRRQRICYHPTQRTQ